MSLTDAKVRAAKAKPRPYKLSDSGGLFVLVTPSGGKLWRLKFRHHGKEKSLALGAYPKISLQAARKQRDAACDALETGTDPAAEKKRQKRAVVDAAAITFEIVARQWHANHEHEWTPDYARQVLSRLKDDIFPDLGKRPIAAIEPKEMLAVLKKVEARGVLETTRRLKQYCSSIFRFAIASDFCKHDPAAPLKGALKPPRRPVHHKALTRDQVGEFLIRLTAYDGEPETRIALNLTLITGERKRRAVAHSGPTHEDGRSPSRAAASSGRSASCRTQETNRSFELPIS
jgi:hypothetical protein